MQTGTEPELPGDFPRTSPGGLKFTRAGNDQDRLPGPLNAAPFPPDHMANRVPDPGIRLAKHIGDAASSQHVDAPRRPVPRGRAVTSKISAPRDHGSIPICFGANAIFFFRSMNEYYGAWSP